MKVKTKYLLVFTALMASVLSLLSVYLGKDGDPYVRAVQYFASVLMLYATNIAWSETQYDLPSLIHRPKLGRLRILFDSILCAVIIGIALTAGLMSYWSQLNGIFWTYEGLKLIVVFGAGFGVVQLFPLAILFSGWYFVRHWER